MSSLGWSGPSCWEDHDGRSPEPRLQTLPTLCRPDLGSAGPTLASFRREPRPRLAASAPPTPFGEVGQPSGPRGATKPQRPDSRMSAGATCRAAPLRAATLHDPIMRQVTRLERRMPMRWPEFVTAARAKLRILSSAPERRAATDGQCIAERGSRRRWGWWGVGYQPSATLPAPPRFIPARADTEIVVHRGGPARAGRSQAIFPTQCRPAGACVHPVSLDGPRRRISGSRRAPSRARRLVGVSSSISVSRDDERPGGDVPADSIRGDVLVGRLLGRGPVVVAGREGEPGRHPRADVR